MHFKLPLMLFADNLLENVPLKTDKGYQSKKNSALLKQRQ